ncbi:hypothetical protein HDE_06092 [Halotydeus destructor]|nr:hypothetical protein HDE_06092 [Halotydeus destructor]
MIRGYLTPASYADIRDGKTTWKQYSKMDLVTLALLVLLSRYYVIIVISDERQHRLLGYLFAAIGMQGKVLIFTITFFILFAIGFKVFVRRQAMDKTLDHLFDMIPLVQGGDDRVVARKMGLTLPNLQALKFRVKLANMAVAVSSVNFPLAMAILLGIGLYISVSHEHCTIYTINYVFWFAIWIYLTYLMALAAVSSMFCWYAGMQLIKLRFRQINRALSAIRDDELDLNQLDAILSEQNKVTSKVHRYNIALKTYIFLLIFICSPLLGTVLYVTIYVEFKIQLIKAGLIMIAGVSVANLWFLSSTTADVNIEVYNRIMSYAE